MKLSSAEHLARPALLVATIAWAASFVIMKNTLDDIGLYYLLAIRFIGAAMLLGLLFHSVWGKPASGDLRNGLLCGIFLFCAYALQTEGLKTTTPGKNAFLTAVDCVLVPFLLWFFTRKKPSGFHVAAGGLGILGIGCISLNGEFGIAMGDLLTLGGGLLFAVHIIAVSELTMGRSVIRLTTLQFLTAGILSLIFAVTLEEPPRFISRQTAGSLVYLCVFATALAFLCQIFGQRHLSAASTSLILSLEAVFSVIFSFLFAAEPINGRILLGFFLILLAILISEVLPSSLQRFARPHRK